VPIRGDARPAALVPLVRLPTPPQTSPITNSRVLQNTTFGVLDLSLRATSYDWRFVPDPGKTFTDAGSKACQPTNLATRLRN
jgi:hypothetical protein